jgi:mono/diheme cytochrome c family protein
MSRDDMAALWIYLRLMPAVSHATPQAALIFPFNLRPGLAIWQSLYYKPTPFTPLSAKSEAWNRGHYLVEALGHCNTCHSSLNSAAGAEGSRHLTQAQLTGWYIPALEGDPLAGNNAPTKPCAQAGDDRRCESIAPGRARSRAARRSGGRLPTTASAKFECGGHRGDDYRLLPRHYRGERVTGVRHRRGIRLRAAGRPGAGVTSRAEGSRRGKWQGPVAATVTP